MLMWLSLIQLTTVMAVFAYEQMLPKQRIEGNEYS
jgi:hypothetical protein